MVPRPRLANDFHTLLTDSTDCDFEIKTESRMWKVHKVILSARSSVFKTMLSSNFKESNENRLEITDTDADVINEIICYMYSGKVPNLQDISSEETVNSGHEIRFVSIERNL